MHNMHKRYIWHGSRVVILNSKYVWILRNGEAGEKGKQTFDIFSSHLSSQNALLNMQETRIGREA